MKILLTIWGLGIGDWGLGIGDWAQSPIPNPQSPIPNPHIYFLKLKYIFYYYIFINNFIYTNSLIKKFCFFDIIIISDFIVIEFFFEIIYNKFP